MEQRKACIELLIKYYPIYDKATYFAEFINKSYIPPALIQLGHAFSHIYQCINAIDDEKAIFELKCAEGHFNRAIIDTFKYTIMNQNDKVSLIINKIDKFPSLEKNKIISYKNMLDDFYTKLDKITNIEQLEKMKELNTILDCILDNYESINFDISVLDKKVSVYYAYKIFLIFLAGVFASGIFAYILRLIR
ncbi:MAG: hypothetical protein FJ134_12105 [Deltaproteobacteria bacterium]|nr:hypothetical protein [Deltaproteobacteria bacterium]